MKKTKIEFEIPTWLLAVIYILECAAAGVILGVTVGLLLD